jgi:RNA polymerase sigma-70 factor (ECF subfamily)
MALNGDRPLFEEHRPVLLGLAYRLLGSMHDAQDVVQDAWVRWVAEDRRAVRDPRAFLVTVVTRLALDELKTARRTRESYVGPWLPEPVDSARLGPLDTVELRDTVSLATLHVLERLSPPERAVFVLREAFALPHEDIARTIGVSSEHCRQLLSRAKRRIATGPDRSQATAGEHVRLLTGFLAAAESGDLTSLQEMLADDVVAWNDGGGRVRAALLPIHGRERVIAFVAGLVRRFGSSRGEVVAVNGHPALRTSLAAEQQLVAVDIQAGRITAIYVILNPDKLHFVEAFASGQRGPGAAG